MTSSTLQHTNIPFSTLHEFYLKDETKCVHDLMALADLPEQDRFEIGEMAARLVEAIREDESSSPVIDSFLQEYSLSTEEGITLMRLSEALIRTPDQMTAFKLFRDKLSPGDWKKHLSKSGSFWVDRATQGLGIAKNWIKMSGGIKAENLAARLGDAVMHIAVSRVMALMGEHYVLGKSIDAALDKASKSMSPQRDYSFDMLGEAAHTPEDAARYFASYKSAITTLARRHVKTGSKGAAPGLSVKLSALHCRYEYAQRARCVPELVAKLKELALIAKSSGLGISIDAEEADRLEISLLVIDALMRDPDLSDWDGLGIVVQAYQRRAVPVLEWLIDRGRAYERKINVRLVKGAYWDAEIKRAQEMGLSSYPVFTRKDNTDISYIACARLLFTAQDIIFPRFATHNALTAAAIIKLAGPDGQFEFQRLHGMGEQLHNALIKITGGKSRVYAPVGKHSDLLPYLVRRLLENGANSSFVNQLTSAEISIADIITDPFTRTAARSTVENSRIISPRDQFSGIRLAAKGIDLTQAQTTAEIETIAQTFESISAHSLINGKKPSGQSKLTPIYNPANGDIVGHIENCRIQDVDSAIKSAKASSWLGMSAQARSDIIANYGDLLEADMPKFLQLCVMEAGKSWLDALAEVREAVDFCRYYAQQAKSDEMANRNASGVIGCISPWNFPLAIFLGQITGSLAAGNTVIAKPAPQTPLVAFEAIKLLYKAGVPKNAVHLLIGDGREIGSHLTAHNDVDGICFTGSTATAKIIGKSLVATNRSHIPFIAETGGINAMIVDSTALIEQAVTDVIASAFQSAGQRCSACRVVCIQDDVAEKFITMLSGAMDELIVAAPKALSTDVGPVIDEAAQIMLTDYVSSAHEKFKAIGSTPLSAQASNGTFIAPMAFEISKISDLNREVFGPILHVIRFEADEIDDVVKDINALGYGLTMGLHTRIDDRVDEFTQMAEVGNLYVNRNQIGAVVGVQPFGGEGLSGTGPKAGGPLYMRRLSRPEKPQTSSEGNDILEGVDLAQSSSLTADLKASRAAGKNWRMAVTPGLVQKLYDIFKEASISPTETLLNRLINSSALNDNDRTLPGPTGETNELKFHARGILICLGGGAAQDIVDQVFIALSTGNSVLVLTTPETQETITRIKAALNEITSAQSLLQTITTNEIGGALCADINGIVVEGPAQNKVTEFVWNLEGPIHPILSKNDEPERFIIERTVTINTTAAGGNATLLAL